LVKKYVVSHLAKLHFRSGDQDYAERLAKHISNNGYEAVVVSQSRYGDAHGVSINQVWEQLEEKPRLIFLGQQCSAGVTQSANDLQAYDPKWAAVSELVAMRFMPERDVQVIYGPAVEAESQGVDIRKEFGVPDNAKLLGFIGNTDEVFVEQMLEVVKRFHCLLLIAGCGGRVSSISSMGGPVKVVPSIPNLRGDWYRAFDCFFYPVRASGFPMFVLEAGLSGCHVAMTPVSDCLKIGEGRWGFGGKDVDSLCEAVRKATTYDADATRDYLLDRFALDHFLSDWHQLLS
jgi:hypothetical protein